MKGFLFAKATMLGTLFITTIPAIASNFYLVTPFDSAITVSSGFHFGKGPVYQGDNHYTSWDQNTNYTLQQSIALWVR